MWAAVEVLEMGRGVDLVSSLSWAEGAPGFLRASLLPDRRAKVVETWEQRTREIRADIDRA